LKIINFISGKDLGGPKQSFLLYSKALKNNNIEVVSIIKKGAKLASLLKSNNLEYNEISYVRSSFFLFKYFAIKKLKKELKKYKNYTFLVHKQVDIELIRKALGNDVKIIGVIHGFNAKHIENSNALIAVSKKVKDFLIKQGYDKPVFVIPNMIEVSTKVKIKEPSTPLVIGSMGIFRRKKGFHILIKALAILKEKGVPFKAYIAGRGKRLIYLKYLSKKYQLNDSLEFVGWINNDKRDEFFEKIDIYCLPSLSESFGMAALEAMSRAKVVLATKCGGPEEFIEDNINGFLTNKNSAISLADKLEELIAKKEKLKDISFKAYEDSKKYDADILINKVIDIVNTI
jgi:glycosyltransferase involved in cell wall biosynthesis